MTIEIRYDENRKILDVSVSGKPDLSDFTSALKTITSAKDYPPNTNAIWDLRKADFSSFDDDMLNRIIEVSSQFKQRARLKTALIASSGLQLAFSRALQMFAERRIPQEVMVFKEYSEGEQFILEDQLPK